MPKVILMTAMRRNGEVALDNIAFFFFFIFIIVVKVPEVASIFLFSFEQLLVAFKRSLKLFFLLSTAAILFFMTTLLLTVCSIFFFFQKLLFTF